MEGVQESGGSIAIHDLLPLLYRPRPDLAGRVRRTIARNERRHRRRKSSTRATGGGMIFAWTAAAGILLAGTALIVTRFHDDGLRPEDGQVVGPGAMLVSTASGRWRWPATGASLELAAKTIAHRGTGPGDLQVDAGSLSAQIDHQEQRTPLIIRTPHAVATVVGTSFRLDVDDTRSRLQVDRGIVSFIHDGHEERIHAGETAVAPEAAMPPASVPPAASDDAGPVWRLHETGRSIVTDARLRELSGMAVDPTAPDRLWACGDHGNPAALFALDQLGRVQDVQPVAGAVNHDWEELCPVLLDGQTWLAIGDIGKSRGKEPAAILLVAPHPPLTVARRMTLHLPDGVVDLDCLAWDGIERAFYLVGKDGSHPLLRCAWSEESSLTAMVMGRMDAHRPSALAIDRSGTRMALLDQVGMVSIFGRRDGAWDLIHPRCRLRLSGPAKPQALAWGPEGDRLWVAGEGLNAPLIEMRLVVSPP